MRGSIVALSFAGLLASLTGCDKKPIQEDTRHLENPPPKPPNCPSLPELKNITLRDGAIEDVRIVQFRETKLYFPTRLLKSHFIEKWRHPQSGFVERGVLGNFNPDIHLNECPGIVHHIADEKQSFEGIYPMIGMRIAGLDRDAQFLSASEGFWALRYGLNPNVVSPHAKFILGLNQKIIFNSDVIVQLVVGSTAVSGVDYKSQSVLALTNWLMTPPARRNNDQNFTLEIDRVIKK